MGLGHRSPKKFLECNSTFSRPVRDEMGSAHTHWLPGSLPFSYDASLHLTWFLVQVLMECAIYDKLYVKRQGQVQAM